MVTVGKICLCLWLVGFGEVVALTWPPIHPFWSEFDKVGQRFDQRLIQTIHVLQTTFSRSSKEYLFGTFVFILFSFLFVYLKKI